MDRQSKPLDYLVAAGIFAVTIGEIAVNDIPGSMPVLIAATFAECVLLIWRRRHSQLVAFGVVFANTLPNYFGTPSNQSPTFALVAIVIAMYSLGRYGLENPAERRRTYVSFALCLIAFSTMTFIQTGPRLGDLVFFSIFAFAPMLFGRAIAVSQHERAKAEAATERAVQTSDQLREQAVRDERERIARELHDVIAHSVSLMGLQAGAARKVLPPGNEPVEASLRSIEETGRDTIGELRRMLGVMRDHEGREDLAPQPGLHVLPELAEQVRAGGIDVQLELGEGLSDLSPGVDLAAFRIAQEALTNAVKHAPQCPVELRAGVQAGRIDLRVLSRGAQPTNGSANPEGNGVVGMQERAALYGGELSAGFEPEGFVVSASLPAEYLVAERVNA